MLDQFITEFDRAIKTLTGHHSGRASQRDISQVDRETELTDSEKKLSSSLMRVNHTGEVCAQALYSGQLLTARDDKIRRLFLEAVEEEITHLKMTGRRLRELESKPSLFDPIFYTGSFALGVLAGVVGDKWSLGFVEETERQVEKHLEDHLERLPSGDVRSKAILEQMKEDEARHADHASEAGAATLPDTAKSIMSFASKLMKVVSYRL